MSWLGPAEFQDRYDADAFGLLGVIGEAVVAACLLGVDAVAFLSGEVSNGNAVALGSPLNRSFARRREVVVPVGVRRVTSPCREYVDDVVVGLIRQVHQRVDVCTAGLTAAMMHQDHRRAFEVPADAAFVGTELLDDPGVPVG